MAKKKRDIRQKDPQEMRQILLDSARTVFAESGYGGAKVELIAQVAGANKAMINYHFGGKQGLYRAMIARFIEEAAQHLASALEGKTEPQDRLRAYIHGFSSLFSAQPDRARVMLRELISQTDLLDAELRLRFMAVFGLLRQIIEEGIQKGCFRPVNPFFIHINIVSNLLIFISASSKRQALARESSERGLAMPPIDVSDLEFTLHVENLMLSFLQDLEKEKP